ncbi:MAG: hypothetical protein WC959_08800 [Kiritimatiellales bacterium]
MNYKKCRQVFLAAFVVTAANLTFAATNRWNVGTGDWSNGSNWIGGLPASADDAHIDNGGTATITNSQSVNSATAGHDVAGTIAVNTGGTLNSTDFIHIGRNAGASGILTIDGGTVTGISGLHSGSGNGSGTVNVLNGGTITLSSGLYSGYAGSGSHQLTIDGNGSIVAVNTNGNAVIFGRGGTVSVALVITNGGQLIATGHCFLANGANTTVAAVIDGAGSAWTVGRKLTVGTGSGTLTIQNGGLVSADEITIGAKGMIRIRAGGALALKGNVSTLSGFMNLVTGSAQKIQYWNGTGWADITAAQGSDYTLDTYTHGSDTYTKLTVRGVRIGLFIMH